MYIICPSHDKSSEPFEIYEVKDNGFESILINDFPDYEDLRRKILPDVFNVDEIKREELVNAFNNFLQYKKGFPENVIARDRLIDVDKPSPDIALIDPESSNVLALVEFSTTSQSLDSLKKIAQEYFSITPSPNNPQFYFVELAEMNSPEQFKIFLLSSEDEVEPISMADFPTYNQMLFANPLDDSGRRLYRSLVELVLKQAYLGVKSWF